MQSVILDGGSLTLESGASVSRDFTPVTVSPAAAGRAMKSRTVVERAVARGAQSTA